jgi:hypothetical protein
MKFKNLIAYQQENKNNLPERKYQPRCEADFFRSKETLYATINQM